MAKTKTSYRINIHPRMARDIVIEFTDPLEGIRELRNKEVIDEKTFRHLKEGIGLWETIAQIERSAWRIIIYRIMSNFDDKWDFTIAMEKTSGLFKGRVKETTYPSRTLILWMEDN